MRPSTGRPSPLATDLLLATPIPAGRGDDDAAGTPGARPAVTCWADLAPVMNTKCARCRQAGGVAPVALDSYQQAKKWAANEVCARPS